MFLLWGGMFLLVRRTLAMKMIRLALFFAAGMYLGVHADNLGDLEMVAQSIGDLIEHARKFR